MVLFCFEYDNVAHRRKAYDNTNDLTYDMLKSVAKYGAK